MKGLPDSSDQILNAGKSINGHAGVGVRVGSNLRTRVACVEEESIIASK